MRIRAARGDDFERVAALLELLGRPAIGRADHEDAKAIYELQVVEPNTHHVVVEEDGGRIVGFMALHFRDRLNYTTPEAWVPDLFVLESARDAGIERRLLDEAERRARERGCHQIVTESGYKRAEAHELFRTFRMRDAGKYFRKQLGG